MSADREKAREITDWLDEQGYIDKRMVNHRSITSRIATALAAERAAVWKAAIAAVPQVGVTFPNGYEEWVDAPFYREMVIAALERAAGHTFKGRSKSVPCEKCGLIYSASIHHDG